MSALGICQGPGNPIYFRKGLWEMALNPKPEMVWQGEGLSPANPNDFVSEMSTQKPVRSSSCSSEVPCSGGWKNPYKSASCPILSPEVKGEGSITTTYPPVPVTEDQAFQIPAYRCSSCFCCQISRFLGSQWDLPASCSVIGFELSPWRMVQPRFAAQKVQLCSENRVVHVLVVARLFSFSSPRSDVCNNQCLICTLKRTI